MKGKRDHNEKISDSLRKLEDIVKWFDSREDVDIEDGLERVKKGAVLIKSLKARLKNVENEFKEIKKDLEDDESNYQDQP